MSAEPVPVRPDDTEPAGERRRLPGWARILLLIAVSIGAGYTIIGLVGRIDWGGVWQALGLLSPWQFGVLVAALLVRQGLNAVPLSQFVPGLRWSRSLQNDLGANLIGTTAPPPADVVLRVSMFRSWGIDAVIGMAGVTLNMITFYAIRFLVPAVGAGFLAFQEWQRHHVVAALTSGAISLAILVGLTLLMRGEQLARVLGVGAGRVARRVRSGVDPDQWGQAVVDFRGSMAVSLRSGLPKSLAAMLLMVLADGSILLMSLRFVGVDATAVSFVEIYGAFLIAYPLTLFPLFGFGLLDASLVASWTLAAGTDYEASIVAAVIIWRVVTLFGPLLLGALAVAIWRRGVGRSETAS